MKVNVVLTILQVLVAGVGIWVITTQWSNLWVFTGYSMDVNPFQPGFLIPITFIGIIVYLQIEKKRKP